MSPSKPPRRISFLTDELLFPPPSLARRDGLLAIGGDLSVPRLLLAYRLGIFPWYDEETPILWWSPPQRAVVAPAAIHVGRSLRKVVRRGTFEIRFDCDFAGVIHGCACTPRPGQPGTWIVPEVEVAYTALHYEGYAHSVETYLDGKLVGGLYGVSLGGAFFGESMFSRADDASKVAFVALCDRLCGWGFDFVDCQLMNDHVERFGAALIPRADFLARLHETLKRPTRRGSWAGASAATPDAGS